MAIFNDFKKNIMKIIGNKNNLERIKKKEQEIQNKIFKKEEEKLKAPFLDFGTKLFIWIFVIGITLYNFKNIFNFFSH